MDYSLPQELCLLKSLILGEKPVGDFLPEKFTKEMAYLNHHGLISLILSSLPKGYPVPESLLRQGKELAMRRLGLLATLRLVGKILDEAGINFVLLKGLSTEASFYPKELKRDFGDIDIIVAAEDVCRVDELFLSQGFIRNFALNSRQFEAELLSQHGLPYAYKDNQELDLHWRLIQKQYGFREAFENYFENTIEIEKEGVCVPALSLERQLYLLCLQAYKGLWRDPKGLLDIYFALQSNKCDCRAVRSLFSNKGDEIIFDLSSAMARVIWGEGSASVLSSLENKSAALVLPKIIASFSSPQDTSEFAELKLELALRGTLMRKFDYIKGRLFVPHEEDWNSAVPENLFFLHYLLKPTKVIFKATQSLLRR